MTDGSARRFHFDTCLGRGGFGEVYRARMTRGRGFEVEVAVKLLRADVDPRGHAASRLKDEARMLGMVRHRCVPQVFDLVELDGRMALVSEYVEGADLSKCLRAAPRLPRRACLEVLAGVADALHAAYHTPVRGGGFTRIVHRDLKPANVRIARDGTPKLLDFGIAWTDAVTRVAMTQSSALVGSPAYMAPERFDAAPPTAAVDVFGLGAMLYEALTGKRLFAELAFKELAAIALVEPRYIRALDERLLELPDDTSPELRALLANSLAFAPGARPTTEEVARRLESIAQHTPGPTLVAWCRDRTWGEDGGVGGAWCGRTVVEGHSGADPDRVSTWDPAEPLLQLSPEVLTAESGPIDLSDVSLASVVVVPERPRWADPRSNLLRVAVPVVVALLAAAMWAQPPERDPVSRGLAAEVAPGSLVASAAPAPAPTASPPTASPPTASLAAPSPTVSTPPSKPPARDARVSATRTAILPSVDALLGDDVDASAPDPSPRPTRASPAPTHTATEPTRAAPSPTSADAPSTPAATTATAGVRPHTVGSATPTAARVTVAPGTSASEVTLIGDSGRWRLPAELTPGRYKVQADFGLGVLQSAGSVEVSGVAVAVRCAMSNCVVVH